MADSSVPASSPLQMKCDLWWQFTVRSVEMRHRGSYLGVIWTVLNPLLMLGMYVVVFGLIFRSKFNAFPNETPVDYSLAVFMGLILFHITADTIAAAPTRSRLGVPVGPRPCAQLSLQQSGAACRLRPL